MSELLKRLKKTSTIDTVSFLDKSIFFNDKDVIPTKVPAFNIALSGSIDGGLTPGLTIIAGPSKHFKSGLALLSAKAYLDKYDDAVVLFYDSEFGTPPAYFKSFGIDTSRVLHTPILNIEELKFDIVQQLDNIKRGDRVIIIIDSIGNLASKKEANDALNQNSAADMTRAKELKSIFRIITPHLTAKDIPMVAIGHIYMTMEMYSKPVLSGGTGWYLAADNILIMGRQQEKDGKEIVGYNFILNVEKSRHVKEKSKIPLSITYENGISKFSGLMDMGLESGFVIKPNMGWYSRVDMETGEIEPKKWRLDNTNTDEFWNPILKSDKFKEWVYNKYSVSTGNIMGEETDSELEDIFSEVDDETVSISENSDYNDE